MARIGTRKLTLSIDGDEYDAQVSTAEVLSAESESDFTTFADAAAGGGRDYKLHLVLAQDAATGSLWRQIWDAAGSEVVAIVRPYGNAVPSATEPHYSGTVVIKEPDGVLLGGEANASASAAMTVDVEWDFLSKPTAIVAP